MMTLTHLLVSISKLLIIIQSLLNLIGRKEELYSIPVHPRFPLSFNQDPETELIELLLKMKLTRFKEIQ